MTTNGLDQSLANISQLAAMFGMGRSTIRSNIERSCISPSGSHKGNNLFKIADVAQVIYGAAQFLEGEEGINPNKLTPSEHKDYWTAQHKEVDYKVLIREYLSKDEVRRDYKELQDSLKEKVQSFPDVLERDQGVAPIEVERMITLCDKLLVALHETWND